MSDPQVLNTLHEKRKDIEGYIADLERKLTEARMDLSHVLATIRLFAADGERVMAYMNMSRIFPRNELPRLAREALSANPDGMDTRELALYVIKAKGLDTEDRHLRKAIALQACATATAVRAAGRACQAWEAAGGRGVAIY